MSNPTQYEQDPDYDRLVEMLIQKTKDGKIDWQETAVTERYVASIQGVRSLVVERIENGDEDEYSQTLKLSGTDSNGRTLFSHFLDTPSTQTLFELARRVATKEDDRLREVVDLLTTL